jgi:subtilase family serine protease
LTPLFGDVVIINATIRNIGDRTNITVPVSFYLDGSETPFKTTSVVMGGKEANCTEVVWKASLIRNHYIVIRVDPSNEITELDESNNERGTGRIFVSGTDLSVDSLDIIPHKKKHFEGDKLTIKANISNWGAKNASEFNVTFYNGSSLIQSFTNLSLDSGETIELNTTWNASSGEYWIEVRIECNEEMENEIVNNKRGIEINVFRVVDFTVTDINFSHENPGEGENVTINATIENLGNRTCETEVAFYVDTALLHTCNVTVNASAGEGTNATNASGRPKTYVTVNWTAPVLDINNLTLYDIQNFASTYEIAVRVDPENRIWEIDENNNTWEKEITLAMPDVSIEILWIEPEVLTIKDEFVNLSVRIKNNNENESVNTTAWFFAEREYYEDITLGPQGEDWPPYRRPDRIHTLESPYGGVSKTKVHFWELNYSIIFEASPRLEIYDKWGNYIQNFSGQHPHQWGGAETKWCEEDEVTLKSTRCYNAMQLAVIDKSYGFFGAQPVSLAGNKSVVLNFSYKLEGRDGKPIPGSHKLWVEVRDKLASENVSVRGTDLAVNFSLNRIVYGVGEQVPINVTIKNLGMFDATSEFKVLFKDMVGDNETIFHVENISGLAVNHSIRANTTWTANPAGRHKIRVEIDPCDNPDENEGNNFKEVIVLVTSQKDFAVTDIIITPEKPGEDDEEVIINATIENLGLGNGTVNVSIYAGSEIRIEDLIPVIKGGTLIGNGSVWVNESKKGYVNVTYKLPKLDIYNRSDAIEGSGDYKIAVWVDSENEHPGEVEDNNLMERRMPLTSGVEIVNVSFDRNPAYNQWIKINATIKNNGTRNITNATVWFVLGKKLPFGKISWSGGRIEQPGALAIRARAASCYWWCRHGVCDYSKPANEKGESVPILGGWTVWTPGKVLSTAGWTHWCKLADFRVLIAERTVSLGVGENRTISIDWFTAPPILIGNAKDSDAVGDYTLKVMGVSEVYETRMHVGGSDLAVTNLSVNDTYFDGEQVNITATIENKGLVNVTHFIVKFTVIPESYSVQCINPNYWRTYNPPVEWIKEIEVEGLAANNSVKVTVPYNASLVKRRYCRCGSVPKLLLGIV